MKFNNGIRNKKLTVEFDGSAMQPPHSHRQNHKLFKAAKPSEVVPYISLASIEPS